jgi:hypothetical protein
LQPRQIGGKVFADQFAIAQHRDAIGDLVSLVEEVRDEEHRHPRVANLPDDGHEFGDFLHIQ